MLWLVTLRPAVVKVAWPAAVTVPVPKVLAPSLNVTVPLGVFELEALGVTVAVNVTAWPNSAGLGEAASVVVVAMADGGEVTVCVSAAEVLPLKFVSPPYTAVIEWLATVRLLVVNVACPEAF